MKDTVVFDLFQVLIDWQPQLFYKDIIKDDVRRDFFINKVMLDDFGCLTNGAPELQPAIRILKEKYPEFSEEIDMYTDNEYKMIKITDEVADTAKKLKESGVKLYLLSNICKESISWAKNLYFFPLFDGAVLSGETEYAKPNKSIFKYLFDKYNVKPEHSVFVDDSQRNINTAKELGMDTVTFTTPNALKAEFSLKGLIK